MNLVNCVILVIPRSVVIVVNLVILKTEYSGESGVYGNSFKFGDSGNSEESFDFDDSGQSNESGESGASGSSCDTGHSIEYKISGT